MHKRKSWLFSDTVKGALASANLYSLVETAKANGLEPHAYLSIVFARLPAVRDVQDFEALLPWNLKHALVNTSCYYLEHASSEQKRALIA